MNKRFTVIAATVLALVCVVFGQSDKDKKAGHSQMGASGAHVMMTPGDVKWGPAPPALPAGAQAALLEGDPSKAGSTYTIRAKLPDGYRIPPHWHPVDENVTVIEGTLAMGLGEKFDDAAGHDMTAGSYARMPKGVRHFAWAKGDTIIQVHGVGPFEVNYVNPSDDPRKKGGSK
ncbi:MAG: cupin domain-containing protein [Blastocatellia bacterium]